MTVIHPTRSPAPPNRDRDQAVANLVTEHLALVWRTLRRLGVDPADLEDATQRVFIIVSERLEDIQPERAQSFVFGTAMRVASHSRRQRKGRREEALIESHDPRDPAGGPDVQLEQQQARNIMADILERMPEELRTTFLLYELEQLTMAEISEMQGIPAGTVASRLRRARERFQQEVKLLEHPSTRTGS